MAAEFLTGIVGVKTPTTLTIAGGVATITQGAHFLTSETSTTDDLDTISIDAGVTYSGYTLFVVLKATATHTITVKHNTGNILLNGAADFSLTASKALLLWYEPAAAKWHNLA